jgi:hypothetical protein
MLSERRLKKLGTLIKGYQREVDGCTRAQAYHAACIILGAQVEGMLLGMCCLRENEVRKWFADLPASQRPKNSINQWDLATLSRVARDLKWLPARHHPRAHTKVGDWVDVLREIRNLVHPGKHIRDYPKVRIGRLHLSDAQAVCGAVERYLLSDLANDLKRASRRKRTGAF